MSSRQLEFDKLFLRIAREISNMSTCVSFKVGCVIVKNNRIISTGYNGSPSGCIHCNKQFKHEHFDREDHTRWSLNNEIHAEMNAILIAAKNGISIDGAILYSTLQPCRYCTKNILNSGIQKIIFEDIYNKNDDIEVLKKFTKLAGVEYVQLQSK